MNGLQQQRHTIYTFICVSIFACATAIQAVTPKPPKPYKRPQYFTFSSAHVARSEQKNRMQEAQKQAERALRKLKEAKKTPKSPIISEKGTGKNPIITPSNHDGIDKYIAKMRATEQAQKNAGR